MFVSFSLDKTLLSESVPEESRWPPELILLREKFTAKSQLEIAQLQIKHVEEVYLFAVYFDVLAIYHEIIIKEINFSIKIDVASENRPSKAA